jgi:hypothetical protein
MLYLCIFTFDTARRKAVLKRRASGGEKIPDGVRILMEVMDLTQNRVFRLCQAPDMATIESANAAWRDLGHIETVPVVESEQIVQKLMEMEQK